MEKSILILSGGLDSTVAAWMAAEESKVVLALTFDYGQKAAEKEKQAAKKTAGRLSIVHKILKLPWLQEITTTSLVAVDKDLPRPHEKNLDEIASSLESAKAVWVPNRNGIFLNIAAAFAESLDASLLVTGFNAEEARSFPDNSASFLEMANGFFRYSTQKHVTVTSPTLLWDKETIARQALKLKIPLHDLWFCYEGGAEPCRSCESCLRNFRAFQKVRET